MNEYLYVLDFCAPGIYEIILDDKDQDIEIEEILDRRGLKSSNCNFMFTSEKLELETINLKNDESV